MSQFGSPSGSYGGIISMLHPYIAFGAPPSLFVITRLLEILLSLLLHLFVFFFFFLVQSSRCTSAAVIGPLDTLAFFR